MVPLQPVFPVTLLLVSPGTQGGPAQPQATAGAWKLNRQTRKGVHVAACTDNTLALFTLIQK